MSSYFDALQHQLVDAAARDNARQADRGPRARRRRSRTLAIGLAVTAVLVPAAGAVATISGVFTPHREPDGLVRLSERQVVAAGRLADRGPWQLVLSRSDVGWCFGLRIAQIPGEPPSVGEGCGGAVPGSLHVATQSGGSFHLKALAFGIAPSQARRIEVRTAGGVMATTDALDDDKGVPGRFYLVELPVRTTLGAITVTARDADGRAIARTAMPPVVGRETRPKRRSRSGS